MDLQVGKIGTTQTDLVRTGGPARLPEQIDHSGVSNLPHSHPIVDQGFFSELSDADLARLIGILEHAIEDEQLASAMLRIPAPESEGDQMQLLPVPVADNPQPSLNRATAVARLDAEARLALAAETLDAVHPRKLNQWDAEPETLMRIGNRLFDAGGYANYVRATDVAQVLIDAARFVPIPAPLPITVSERPRRWQIAANQAGVQAREWGARARALAARTPQRIRLVAIAVLALIVLALLLVR